MSALTDILLAPDVRPFAVAAAIMLALGGIELLTTLVGFLDQRTHRQGHRGRDRQRQRPRRPVPVDQRGTSAAVDPDHPRARRVRDRGILPAGPRARRRDFDPGLDRRDCRRSASACPAIRVTSRGIARIIPRDETYAVEEADFIGHVAEVSIGPLDQGLPGRVRLKDVFGNWHSLVARASPESTPLPVGASVLLVDRDAKSFIAISAPADLIAQQRSDRA